MGDDGTSSSVLTGGRGTARANVPRRSALRCLRHSSRGESEGEGRRFDSMRRRGDLRGRRERALCEARGGGGVRALEGARTEPKLRMVCGAAGTIQVPTEQVDGATEQDSDEGHEGGGLGGLDDIMIGTHGQEDTEQDDEDQGNENLQRGVPDTIVQVPLKQHDGGTERDSDQDEGSDSFARWSNDNARMMYLLTLDEGGPDGANDDNEDWMKLVGYQGLRPRASDTTERQTRLSTELHDSAFFSTILGLIEQG